MWWTKIVFTHIRYTLLFTIIKIKQNDSIVDRSKFKCKQRDDNYHPHWYSCLSFYPLRLFCFGVLFHPSSTHSMSLEFDESTQCKNYLFCIHVIYPTLAYCPSNATERARAILVSKSLQPWLESTARGRLHRWSLDWKLRSLQQQSTQNEWIHKKQRKWKTNQSKR